VPSWHLGIRETLALLDLVRDLMAVLDLNRDLSAEVERLRGALEAERRQHALIARNRARDAETATERQACEDIARCIERSRPARKGHTP
jgi:cell division septum initiation protein DivIVA